jgi:integrase
MADHLIEGIEHGFRNAKHRYQWRQTLTQYAKQLRPKPVDAIMTEDVLECLNRSLSNMAMRMTARRAGIEFTVHGFRSAFRDWAGERTNFPREVAEAALAHVVGDATERAYRRGDALEKRRALMEAWATFCEPTENNVVVPMARSWPGKQ